MIKQGRNIITCDSCKAEINQIVMTTKYLKEIQINFFRCSKCSTKYLVSVTNKEVREKQQELRKWSEQHKRVLDINLDNLSKEEFNKLALLLNETESNMKRLQAEIKSAMAELKKKYEGDL